MPTATGTAEASKKSAQAGSLSACWNDVVPFALIFLACVVLFFSELGRFPLFNPDEALYGEPAREMLENRDFITTYLNYVVRFTKPPLVIWAQALGITLFGVNEFAVRFFEAACGAVLVAATYWFAARFSGRGSAIASAICLMTAPLFLGTARLAITDVPLSLFVGAGLMCLYTARCLRVQIWLWLGYALVGLAVMTKGPVGAVLPVAVLAVYHLFRGDLLAALRWYRLWLGGLIVSAIALPWFVTEIAITKGAYFNEFILRENVQRYTSVVDSHKGAWWYHVAAMFGGFLPWAVLVPQAVAGAIPFAGWREAWRQRSFARFRESVQRLQGEHDLLFFCSIWVLVTLVFFSASVSKLLPYTLPAFPALAVLTGIELSKIARERSLHRVLVPAAVLAVAFSGVMAAIPLIAARLRDAPDALPAVLQAFATFELVAVLACVILAARGLLRASFFTFTLATMSAYLFFGSRLLTMLSDHWEQPLPAMASFAALSSEPVIVYDMRKPSMPFYARRQVVQPASSEQLVSTLSRAKRAYILTKARTRPVLEAIPGCKILRQEGRYLLAAYRQPQEESSGNFSIR